MLAAFPGPVSVLVALLRFGKGPGGVALAGDSGDADGLADAERVVLALAVEDTEARSPPEARCSRAYRT